MFASSHPACAVCQAGPSGTDAAWDNISRPQEELVEPLLAPEKRSGKGSWAITIATLLSLQLGWGLWLTPSDYARQVCLFSLNYAQPNSSGILNSA